MRPNDLGRTTGMQVVDLHKVLVEMVLIVFDVPGFRSWTLMTFLFLVAILLKLKTAFPAMLALGIEDPQIHLLGSLAKSFLNALYLRVSAIGTTWTCWIAFAMVNNRICVDSVSSRRMVIPVVLM